MSYRFNKDKRNSKNSAYQKGQGRSLRSNSEDAPNQLNIENGRARNKNNQIIRKHNQYNTNPYSQRSYKGAKNNVQISSNGQNLTRW